MQKHLTTHLLDAHLQWRLLLGVFCKKGAALRWDITMSSTRAVRVLIAVFTWLVVGGLGCAPAAYAQQILQPNQEYTEASTDLTIQTLAGPVSIRRTWIAGQWYLNPAWANLRLIPDPIGGVLAVDRAGSIYEQTGSDATSEGGRIYRFDDDNFIQQTSSGWRWYDRLGNSVLYSSKGVIQEYGNPYGAKVSFRRDAQGRMVNIQDPQDRTIYTLSYDSSGRVERIADLGGAAVRYQWNSTGQLEEVMDSRGQRWRYEYDSKNQIVRRTNPAGASLKITYATPPGELPASAGFSGLGSGTGSDGAGGTGVSSGRTKVPAPRNARVSSYQDEEGAIWNYRVEYDRTRQQYSIAIQRPDTSQAVRRYSRDGWLLYASLQDETQFQRSIDSATQHRLLNAAGQTTTIHYNSIRRPLRTIHPDGSSESSEYDGQGRMVRHTDALGVITTWQYDARGSLLEVVEALGLPEQRAHRYSYDEWGYVLTYSRGAGNGQGADAIFEHYAYDSWGNARQWTDGIGQKWAYTHNVRGDVESETTPLGHTWRASYDSRGATLRTEDPLGQSRQYQYDSVGLPSKFTDAMGQNWDLAYDKTGRLTQLTDPLGHAWKKSYDPLGRITLRTNPSGLQARIRHDLLGRSVEATDPAGNSTRYEYGAKDTSLAGMRIATAYPTFRDTYKYNQRGWPTQRMVGTSRTFHYAWDAMGRHVGTTNPAGHATVYRRDALGRLVEIVDSLNQSTRQTWDAHDRVTSVTDAKGNTHRYDYDKAGKRIEERRPEGGLTLYQYDADGQFIRRTDAGGNTRHYEYDKAGSLMTEEHKLAGVVDQRVVYQNNANGFLTSYQQEDGSGRRISAITYQRDGLNRITHRAIRYGDTITQTVGQSYNEDGQLSGHTYPDGSNGRYSYVNGQLSQVQLPDGSAITFHDYQWYVPTRIQTPGAIKTQSFDELLRPSRIEVRGAGSQVLASRQYEYDLAGNISQINSDLGQTRYSHDSLWRLTQVQPDANLQALGLPAEQYGYDPVHNRTSSAHQPGQWSYNQDNQLLQYPQRKNNGQSLPTQVQYNAQGHTQQEINSDGNKTYGYNAAERLTRFESTSASGARIQAHYQYDPFGRRISKTVMQGATSQTTYYMYGDDGLLAELNEQGAMKRAYGWDPVAGQSGLWGTEPLWQAEASLQSPSLSAAGTSYHHVHTDHLATPMVATDKTGAQTWKAISEAFGRMLVNDASTIALNLRLPGQYFDIESGGHYNYHRDYSPEIGRYVQRDPIGLGGGINAYAYVEGDPLGDIDPDGLNPRGFPRKPAELIPLDGGGGGASGGGRISYPKPPPTSRIVKFCESPSQSPVWKDLTNHRGSIRTNGENGKNRNYYEWDHTHGDIEVFDRNGRHLGSMNPNTGDMHKPAVPGRRLNDL